MGVTHCVNDKRCLVFCCPVRVNCSEFLTMQMLCPQSREHSEVIGARNPIVTQSTFRRERVGHCAARCHHGLALLVERRRWLARARAHLQGAAEKTSTTH